MGRPPGFAPLSLGFLARSRTRNVVRRLPPRNAATHIDYDVGVLRGKVAALGRGRFSCGLFPRSTVDREALGEATCVSLTGVVKYGDSWSTRQMATKRSMRPEMGLSSVRATITFPSELYSTLEKIAEQKKVSLAWVVRDAVEQYIGEKWPLFRGSAS
jgi:hypothetical protein